MAASRWTSRRLEQLLVRFSQLVVEQPWIKEIDINPLLASPERLLALDARVVLHAAATEDKNLSKPVIRPYPPSTSCRGVCATASRSTSGRFVPRTSQ